MWNNNCARNHPNEQVNEVSKLISVKSKKETIHTNRTLYACVNQNTKVYTVYD